jgi:hypothetical protein
MNLVKRNEILELGEYEKVREPFRSRVILEKKGRRVTVGEHISVLFENHDTVLLQIQEMLRTERITRESSVLHEIETYNGLLGGPNQLAATVMVEIPDAAERQPFLAQAKGLERHLVLMVGDTAVRAHWDASRVLEDQASAVMYVKFSLGDAEAAALRSGKVDLAFVVDHPAVAARALLSRETVRSLAEDLTA